MQARPAFEQEQYPGKIHAAEERCVPAKFGKRSTGSGSAKFNGARIGNGAGAFSFEDLHED